MAGHSPVVSLICSQNPSTSQSDNPVQLWRVVMDNAGVEPAMVGQAASICSMHMAAAAGYPVGVRHCMTAMMPIVCVVHHVCEGHMHI